MRWPLFGVAALAAGLAGAAAANPLVWQGATLPPGAFTHPACKVAIRYLELVGQGNAEGVGGLFADNAIYFGIQMTPIKGRAAITAFYAKLLSKVGTKTPHIAGLTPSGKYDCFLEMTGGGPMTPVDRWPNATAVDRFTLDKSGKLVRLYLYFRPDTVDTLRGAGLAPGK